MLRYALTKNNVGFSILSMLNKSVNFEIFPIFNQTVPGVWSDFAHIESECDKKIYTLHYAKKHYLDLYKKDFYGYKHCFAFGAYYKKHMVGFTHGHSDDDDVVYLERLYILPKYQHQGIGTLLLKAAEQTSGLIAEKIKLVSLKSAENFYVKKNGYEQFDYMKKDLKPMANSIVPVFQWVKKDFNVKFDIDVDTAFLKQNKYHPIFVHTNSDVRIDGVAVHTVDGETKIWTDKKRLVPMLSNALNNVR